MTGTAERINGATDSGLANGNGAAPAGVSTGGAPPRGRGPAPPRRTGPPASTPPLWPFALAGALVLLLLGLMDLWRSRDREEQAR